MDYLQTPEQMRYFDYLSNTVLYLDGLGTYTILFEHLHSTPFYAVHRMDENRAGDAIAARLDYERDTGLSCGLSTPKCECPQLEASVFEVLIGIAKRMSFIFSSLDEDLTKDCFWHLLSNLGLSDFNDIQYAEFGGAVAVDEIVDRWLSRSYDISGEGGLFPMAAPRTNQREVEIFYQMNQYHSDPNGIRFKNWASGGGV